MIYISNINNGIEKLKCVGCKVCGDSCVNNAISYQVDNEGFEYPVVDEKKCNNCGACLNVCPVNKFIDEKTEQSLCYSAWSKNDEVREKSTSGGFFYELAKIIIEENGVVIGAKYANEYKSVVHAIAYNIDELDQLLGSKYLQSDTNGIFNKALSVLKKNKKVLFAGTPCQCAAMRKYAENKIDLDNLYLMDFVCYSIYSPMVYKKWLEEMEKTENSKISKVKFKSKKYGWINRCVELEFDNGTKKYQSDLKGEDLFIAGIEDSNLYQRQCCYNCLFREEKHRYSDFTVGDYWGVKNSTEYDLYKGISFVITNSNKANNILKKMNKSMIFRRCELSEIIKGNPNILENPILDEDKRNKFFSFLKDEKFSVALKKATGYKVPNNKNNIYTVKRIFFDKKISTRKYIYYNYICKNVIRKGKAKIVPYKNVFIEFGENSKLIIEGDKNLNVGVNKLSGSKAETYIRLYRDSKMTLKHGADLYYGTTIELMNNAKFDAGYFSMNTGTTIIVDYQMSFGEYIGFGRNNTVYDSDFHALYTSSGSIVNRPRRTVIGNHVWITSNNTILPGSEIGDNVIVGSQNIINYKVPNNSFVRNNKISSFSGWWSELPNLKMETIIYGRKIIQVGFGVEGKVFYTKHKDNVEFIIDNNFKEEFTISFDDFLNEKKEINTDEVFVICSSKYFKELYKMVRGKYPDALIVAGSDFI